MWKLSWSEVWVQTNSQECLLILFNYLSHPRQQHILNWQKQLRSQIIKQMYYPQHKHPRQHLDIPNLKIKTLKLLKLGHHLKLNKVIHSKIWNPLGELPEWQPQFWIIPIKLKIRKIFIIVPRTHRLTKIERWVRLPWVIKIWKFAICKPSTVRYLLEWSISWSSHFHLWWHSLTSPITRSGSMWFFSLGTYYNSDISCRPIVQ